MITKQTKRTLVGSVILLIISATVSGGLYYYIFKQGRILNERAQAVADHAVREQTYAKLKDLLDSSATDRAELDSYFLTEEIAINFLSEIENISKYRGIEVVTDQLTVAEGKEYDTLHVTFTFSGQSLATYEVVSMLESLPYMSYLEKVMVSNQKDGLVDISATVAVTLKKI